MHPLPALLGESMILRCLVWGTDRISRTVFYKNNEIILESPSPTYKITNVTESTAGSYKCDATFRYNAHEAGNPYKVVSDSQDMFVHGMHIQTALSDCLWMNEVSHLCLILYVLHLHSFLQYTSFKVCPLICPFSAHLMKAVVSRSAGLSCSCPGCPSASSYRWYRKDDDDLRWVAMESNHGLMMPKTSGTYACRAVWKNGVSHLSSPYVCEFLHLFLWIDIVSLDLLIQNKISLLIMNSTQPVRNVV